MFNEPNTVAIAWFKRCQYEKLAKIVKDKHNFKQNYDQWLAIERKYIFKYKKRGLKIQKINISIDELVEWCKFHGLEIDEKARALFIHGKLTEQYTGKMHPNIWN